MAGALAARGSDAGIHVGRAHTAELSAAELRVIRSLLDGAFRGDFSDEDWRNTLGGLHVLVRDRGDLVAHAAVVQRRLLHREKAIRTGYVEGLAVRGDRRRRGLASLTMAAAESVIARAYELGALSDGTGIDGFYRRRGWLLWRGETWVLSPDGLRCTPDDDGGIFVLPTGSTPRLDLGGTIACDWRPGDVW